MSVRIMSAVFDRYPNGGSEMLLALALADHASDDGTRVYPSVQALADKTRQSVRTVQYQIRRMQDIGWLLLVNEGNGGRSLNNEYRISGDWLKGANIAPFQKAAKVDAELSETMTPKGCNLTHERVQPVAPIKELKGAISRTKGCNLTYERVQPVAPAIYNHREPSQPLIKSTRKRATPSTLDSATTCPHDVNPQTWADWLQLRKTKRAVVTHTVTKGARSEADKAGMTFEDFLAVWCTRGSQGLEASWLTNGQGQANSQPTETFRERDTRIAQDLADDVMGRERRSNQSGRQRVSPTDYVVDITPSQRRIGD